MIEKYYIGSRPTIRATFRDLSGALADPSDVAVKIMRPDNSEVTGVQAQRVSLGVFEAMFPIIDQPRVWHWWIGGTAGLIAANQGDIEVEISPFTP